jgi:class 3 adenylate cyclase/tetratricopeptide (TPR) repeat protein
VPVCASCGAANPDGFRFCGQCAAALEASPCPSCGASNPAHQRFCGNCGAPLDAGTAPAVGQIDERKLATVLFADVVGFTSLADRTDPELVARMVDTAFRRMAQVVADHGGTVDKYMGDSVMAVFGVPVAHDDDAERAVASGLAMRELGGDLAFSIGVNSGEVIVTAVGREGDTTVIGDTVNVAARLEKAAGAGEVWCGPVTADLAAGQVVFRERPPVPLKGKREPVGVWEAVTLRRSGAAEGTECPPLVGRHDELAFLQAQWEQVRCSRRFQVVVVCGGAGSGKSRLLDELAGPASGDGTVVRSTFPAYGSMSGARMAADLLGQLGEVGDPEVDVRLRSITGDVDPSLQSMDPAAIGHEQLWALKRLLAAKAEDSPLLITVDDLHRSTDRSLEVLAELANRAEAMPVLLVLAGRTDSGAWLSRLPAATTVRLGPLARGDAAALANAFADDRPLVAEASDLLVERASGNPLYLRELVAMAKACGQLVADGDRYRLLPQAQVPTTLQALLGARLDALEGPDKRVFQHVAVLGDSATAGEVAALDDVDPAPALRSLVHAGFLHQPRPGRFEAADPLLREVAYETLTLTVRGELHRRAAAAAAEPEVRAHHLERAANYRPDDAGVVTEAADALAVAGDGFVRVGRLVEGIRLLERAVELGRRQPSVLFGLAGAYSMCGQEEQALAVLATIPDDPADPAVAVERDHIAANTRVFTDPPSAAPALLDTAARWRALGNFNKEAWARANAGVALFSMSRMEQSAAELEPALELFESQDDRSGVVATTSFLSLVKPTDRRVPQWLADALRFADESGDRSKQLTALTALAWHHYFRAFCGGPADVVEARRFARRLAELAGELGARDMAVHGWSLLSFLARATGDLDEASSHATAAEQLVSGPARQERWLASAARFSVTVAEGAANAAAPLPPEPPTDPVALEAVSIVAGEMTAAGRAEEALGVLGTEAVPLLGPLGELVKLIQAFALVVAGRPEEALPYAERAAEAARRLRAERAVEAGAALRAEVTGDATGLPPAPPAAAGLADALVLRAHAALGDATALDRLRTAATRLALPALLTNVGLRNGLVAGTLKDG